MMKDFKKSGAEQLIIIGRTALPLSMLLCISLLFGFVCKENSEKKPFPGKISKDSLVSSTYILNSLQREKDIPFIKYPLNYFEWNDSSAMYTFFKALQHSYHERVRVLHIGDSHVQADIFTNQIRNRLQSVFGEGGRGAVFPYATAKTHAAIDYTTQCAGVWEYARNIHATPKLDLGVWGVSARTTDRDASFRINFRDIAKIDLSKKYLVKIFHKPSEGSFDLKLKYAESMEPVFPKHSGDETVLEAVLDGWEGFLEFSLVDSDGSKTFFEINGLSLELLDEGGILYNSLGINGAGLFSVLNQNLMDQLLRILKPHLVVIDLGGNDYYSGRINEEEYEANIRKIIISVKSAVPDASLLITSPQDIYRKNTNISDCINATKIHRKVAFEMNCGFYNYFLVSGGSQSMLLWRGAELAKSDRVHLNTDGYKLKGELYTHAFLNSYLDFLNKKTPENYNADSMFQVLAVAPEITRVLTERPPAKVNSNPSKTTHRVTSGENLFSISRKYGCSVNDLKSWNNLKSNLLKPGMSLVIYKK